MRTEHHLRKPTLLDYAAGRLSPALSAVAASHLAWCRECRKAVEAAAMAPEPGQEAGPSLLPAGMAGRAQTALKARDVPAAAEAAMSEVSDFGLPVPLAQRLNGCGLEDAGWRKVLPGVAMCELELPPGAVGQLRLVRISPGKALPDHGHGSGELTMVLRGAYRDRHGRYTIGDIADLDGSATHSPEAEAPGPCICLVASEAPVRYISWLPRLWHRFVGF